MSNEDFPSEFDIVIIGTGLTETIVAAAFSRIGLKVLHLDRNGFYGGSYANFSLQGINEWEKDLQDSSKSCSQKSEEEIQKLLSEGENLICLPSQSPQAHHVKQHYTVRHRTPEEIEAAKTAKAGKKAPSMVPFEITAKQETDVPEDANSGEEQMEDTPTDASTQDTGKQPEQVNTSATASIETDKEEMSPSSPSSPMPAESEKDDDREEASSNPGNDKNTKDQSNNDTSDEQSSDSSLPSPSSVAKEWTVEGIQDEGRKFCFDLSPRVLYCSGELVELLIRSDVARYCEFRTVSRVLTFLKGSIEQVPCSRADVFGSKIVSLIEKRLMMKFLQFASDFESSPDEYKDYIGKPFHEFLSSKKLSANVQHFVQHAIAMVNDTATTEEGLKKTQVFLRSLGRYGNTAFLYPLYGSGELPQAFSRLSAVFGGVYCLALSITHIITDQEKKCSGIITSLGQKISCRYFVGEASYLPSSFVQVPEKRSTSRAILITDKSISSSEEAELSLLNFVCEDDKGRPVTVLELPYSASVCPKGVFVVHLTRECKSDAHDAEDDFTEVKNKLFGDGSDETRPKTLWSMYFIHPNLSQVSLSEEAPENVMVTSAGGDNEVDLERVVEEAKAIFHKVCPDEEFLAKPPNPEDIILVDDVETNVSGKTAENETESEKQDQESNEQVSQDISEEEDSKKPNKDGDEEVSQDKENVQE